MGFGIPYILISVDYCQDVYKYVTSDAKPFSQRGISYYLSCDSKEAILSANTANFQLATSFNDVYDDSNKKLLAYNGTQLTEYKRDNFLLLDTTTKVFTDETKNIKSGIMSLIYINNIMEDIQSVKSCKLAISIINYSEDHFCANSLQNQFYSIIFYFFGILGLALLAVGLNKLLISLNPKYLKKLVKFFIILAISITRRYKLNDYIFIQKIILNFIIYFYIY